MVVFFRTTEFDVWLKALRDPIGKPRILARIRTAEHGDFGDINSVCDGVYEMRIHIGPGVSLVLRRRGEVTYLLLCGGDKSSQRRDIRTAQALRKNLEADV